MEKDESKPQPIFSHAEPVFAVRDVSETISYWQEVLGFPAKWTWGEPPSHGAVSWHKAHIQFYQDPERAAASKGNSVWIRLQRVEELYKMHQNKNAEIVAPLQNQPWGMAQYTVREINGYFIHFAGVIIEREKSTILSPDINIIERIPSVTEYRNLAIAVGWSPSSNDDMVKSILAPAIFAVVAEDTVNSEIVGCALLLGDHASFYYVKDVMVCPHWQGKRVGTALMQALINWLEKNGADNALVSLITGEGLEPFYQQFGFAQAFSMIRYIHRNEKNK
jgi:GNAT superfamily N-acetyltransferase